MAFTDFLDPVLGWLLYIHPFVALLIVSFVVSLVITLVYKYATDQKKMKNLKDRIKGFQTEMKKHRDSPDKMMSIQKESMSVNLEYMKESFKPTLITMIPILIIFAWLASNMGYLPIADGEDFTVTMTFDETESENVLIMLPDGIKTSDDLSKDIKNDMVKWELSGDAGDYSISYKIDDQELSHEIMIVEDKNIKKYSNPILKKKDLMDSKETFEATKLKSIVISNTKIKPMGDIPLLRSIPWIGGFGWLGTYIILSLAFSLGLRKLMKVY